MTHFLFLISVSLLVYILMSESNHPFGVPFSHKLTESGERFCEICDYAGKRSDLARVL